ncbi:MAG: GntR family transcriptional regulator [Myxococcales bacterium]|nr:GntR family transcriptional regulator [Myxococcales bacterium]
MLTIEVDFGSQQPVYRQIAEQLRAMVARGELPVGHELPSVRELAGNIGINLNTVAKAYRILADDGLVDLRPGARARVQRVTHARTSEIDEVERQLDDVISRLVLDGRGRDDVSAFLERALARFFERSDG